MFFPQEPRGQGATGISCILLPLQCSQAGAAEHPSEHPSAGTCTLGTSSLPAQGAAGPPGQDVLVYGATPPPITPSPPPAPSAPRRALPPGSLLLDPFNKGLSHRGCVAGTGDEGPPCQGCCLHPAACGPPAQAEGGRERQTLKSIYWCWPWWELLRLPRPWPRCCCGVHGWVEGGAPAMKSPRGASLAPPTPQPPAPRVQRGSSRGRGPGLAPFDVRFLSGSVPGTRGCSAAKGGHPSRVEGCEQG